MPGSKQQAAKEFAAFWKDRGYEKGESQLFWISLLRDVYGIEHPEKFIEFEDQAGRSGEGLLQTAIFSRSRKQAY